MQFGPSPPPPFDVDLRRGIYYGKQQPVPRKCRVSHNYQVGATEGGVIDQFPAAGNYIRFSRN